MDKSFIRRATPADIDDILRIIDSGHSYLLMDRIAKLPSGKGVLEDGSPRLAYQMHRHPGAPLQAP